jgi:hypothetical protein
LRTLTLSSVPSYILLSLPFYVLLWCAIIESKLKLPNQLQNLSHTSHIS